MLDEFRSQKMITDLNPILSGDPISLSRRGMAPVEKRDKLPVIIMSNYTPEECFPNASEHGKLEPLLDRIKVVKCEGPIRIVEGLLRQNAPLRSNLMIFLRPHLVVSLS